MYSIDLHQDISSNCLLCTHKNFFEKNSIHQWWNHLEIPVNNQSDLPRLVEWKVKIVFAAICIEPQEMTKWKKIATHAALNQIYFYQYLEQNSNWKIKIIRNYNEINTIPPEWVWIILHIEGFYFIEKIEDINILDEFYNLWVRSIWFTWNIDNAICGGWSSKNWLTTLGATIVEKVINMNFFIDLAHSNINSFNDILEKVKEYPIVTHTQVKELFAHERNLTDSQIIKIAQKWWLIWLMPHPIMLGTNDFNKYIESIKYIKNLVWIEYVAIGTDFDWTTSTTLIEEFKQSSDFPSLQHKLLQSWLTETETHKILYENALNLIKKKLW